MTTKADIRAEADRLRSQIEARGADVFEADILQPADALLDLYGEDIRARAFVTQDPLRGEMMLRPDFTVPLVQAHMNNGRDAARYTYSGEVFRRQESDTDRASEYMQVGYEVFGGTPADADAEVFTCFHALLDPLSLRAALGDTGLLSAAVAGLNTSEARKAALLRHLWRPRRFKALIDRFSTAPRAVPEAVTSAAQVGLRSAAEVEDRLSRLRQDSAVPPISSEEIALLDTLLAIRETAPKALDQLQTLAQNLPAIAPAVAGVSARFEALDKAGAPMQKLGFEASFGRTTLEYYDGMVFGFFIDNRTDLPPVASGGRYDALTRALGKGSGVPAVGGIIRPALTLEAARC